MQKINPKDYSLNAAKEIKKLLLYFEDSLVVNSDIIERADTDQLFYVYDKRHEKFVFAIYIPSPTYAGGVFKFKSKLFPYNSSINQEGKTEEAYDDIIKRYERWVQLIREYNSISFDVNEKFLKQYEDEVYADFENMDVDSDIAPFDIEQQVLLYNFIEATTKCLALRHPDDAIVEEIIAEANSLKDDVAKVSKKVASKRLSKVLAKIRKYNPVTFRDIYDVAKKEVIKHLLHKGVDNLPKLIEAIQSLV